MPQTHKVEQIPDLQNMKSLFTLEGKVALVTGASGGIGRSTAAGFAELGAKVMLMDLPRQEENLKQYCQEIRERYGSEADYVLGDVSDEASVNAFVAKTIERFGSIDVLHNNAGISMGGTTKIETMPLEKWQREIDINLTGMFIVGRAVANVMKAQGRGGSIINTASMSGRIVNTEAAYCSSKAAIIHLTACMAIEYIKDNIRVNSISFGGMLSGLHETFCKTPETLAARYATLDKNTPIGRLGTLSETVGPVLFLATDLSSYMTGADLLVDGAYAVERNTKNIAD
ncbi:MAG: SDR family oxidoreductase [Ruminococcaceae bacterium]|nr:SDR family oxidoreductase [Oscillospiraceae bacterium]